MKALVKAFQYAGILLLSMVVINGVIAENFFARNLFFGLVALCLSEDSLANVNWPKSDSWLKNKEPLGSVIYFSKLAFLFLYNPREGVTDTADRS